MRTLAVTQNITLDGSIEMLGDWFDPQAGADDADLVAENRRQDEAADALLVGRRTFTDLRGYWRDLDQDATGVSDYLNRVAKYVVSTTMENPDWPGTTVIASDPLATITELKAGSGGDIVVTGSITLTHALLTAGMVDELRLFVYPTVQGAGRRLFPDGAATQLRLARTAAFRSGIVLLCYRLT
jgi:dihydrofolate reductase